MSETRECPSAAGPRRDSAHESAATTNLAAHALRPENLSPDQKRKTKSPNGNDSVRRDTVWRWLRVGSVCKGARLLHKRERAVSAPARLAGRDSTILDSRGERHLKLNFRRCALDGAPGKGRRVSGRESAVQKLISGESTYLPTGTSLHRRGRGSYRRLNCLPVQIAACSYQIRV